MLANGYVAPAIDGGGGSGSIPIGARIGMRTYSALSDRNFYDVVLALRFPSHGEMSAALVRALGLGTLVLANLRKPRPR